jgi:hypothetical protein
VFATTLDLKPIVGGGVKEKVEVISASKDVLLDGKFLFNVDVSSEITVVSSNEVASTAFGSSILYDDWTVNVVWVFNHLWHRAAAVFQPLTLQGTTALPVEDVSIPERGDLEVSEIICSQVFHQGTMRDNDDVLLTEPFGVVEHFTVIVEHQPLIWVGTGEGFVEPTPVFTYGDTEGSETLLPGAVEDLQR